MRSTVMMLLLAGCTEYGLSKGDKDNLPPSTSSGSTTNNQTTPTPPGGTPPTGTPGTDTDTPGTDTDTPGTDPPETDTDTPGTDTGTPSTDEDLPPGELPPPELDMPDDPNDPGLDGGHFDVDTSSFISDVDNGGTDAHVHEYDDQYDVVGVNAMAFLDGGLHDLDEDIVDPDQRFKLIVANGDLSPGARLTVDDVYVANDPRTWTEVDDYDDTDLASLPVWSLGGVAGSSQLDNLGLFFDPDAILDGDLHPTVTGCVRSNVLSLDGAWRNGAITLQAVRVEADGTDGFTTDAALSVGGVQGVATSGLLWEMTLFWHWDGPCADDPDWLTYVPVP